MSTVTTNSMSTAALPETMTVAGEERHVIRAPHGGSTTGLPTRSVIGALSGRLRRTGHRDHDTGAEA